MDDQFALKAYTEGTRAGMVLRREYVRQPQTRAFGEEKRYTVFGRVMRSLEGLSAIDEEMLELSGSEVSDDLNGDQFWSPVPSGAVRTDGTEAESNVERLRKTVDELPGDHPFTEPTGKLPLIGTGNHVVHPIAIYW